MSRFLFFAFLAVLAFSIFRGKSNGVADFPMQVIQQPTPVKSVPADQRVQVLLFTGTEWCPACMNLDKSVIRTEAWKEFTSREIQFRALDFSADRSRVPEAYNQMAKQYNVRSFPTMLVIGKDHEELSRQVGSGPPVENWKAWIRAHEKHFRGDAS